MGEQKMTEMIARKGQLMAVVGRFVGIIASASIIYEDVDSRVCGGDSGGSGSDLCLIGQIDTDKLCGLGTVSSLELFRKRVAGLLVSAQNNHAGTKPGERDRSGSAKAGRSACDHAGLVYHGLQQGSGISLAFSGVQTPP
jgi:hypothetical protein